MSLIFSLVAPRCSTAQDAALGGAVGKSEELKIVPAKGGTSASLGCATKMRHSNASLRRVTTARRRKCVTKCRH